MYELADWGSPVPPEWASPQERLDTRLPSGFVKLLRSRARAEGVTVSVLVHRLLSEAMNMRTVGAVHGEPPATFD